MVFPRLRSVRVRAILVVAAVVVAPLTLVWMSDAADATVGRRMLARVEGVAVDAASALSAAGPSAAGQQGAAPQGDAIGALARRKQVRIRVINADQVESDVDHEAGTSLATWIGAFFFEPGAAPSLAEWDAGQAQAPERDAVRIARAEGHRSGCAHVAEGRLLVCEAALALPDGRVVYVQESSRRSILALHEMRYQLTKLTLVSGLVGLGFGWWLGWRMVRPLELLQRQVMARVAMRRPTPVVLDRDDEFGDLAQSFNALITTLAARDKANEAFAADLVHEVKNPVAAIRAAAEALERPADAERLRRLARVLHNSSARLDALASQFLEIARAEAGLPNDTREPVDLCALVAPLVAAMREDERHAGVTFQIDAAGPALVVGVSERLDTALRNLLENAASFAREGGQSPRVDVFVGAHAEINDTGTRGAEVLVEVRDNGPGIAEADLPRVFDRFYSRRTHGGTGLGLALARAVAEAHGGSLTARANEQAGRNDTTEAARGAVFCLRLPLGRGGA